MVSRRSMALGMVGALGLLMGCGGEPWTEAASEGEVTMAQGALVSSAASHYPNHIAWKDVANLNAPANALGEPDGEVARFATRQSSILRFDLRRGGDGTGNLRIHYQGLPVALPLDLLVAVDFLDADQNVLHQGTARLQAEVADSRIVEVPYPENAAPYSSVRLKNAAGRFALDAIEATDTHTEPTDCQPPNVTCGTECVDTTSSPSHCGACDNACDAGQSCEGSVCAGSGNLQFTATWDRPGDADLYVTTPNDKTIFYNNLGPSYGTDFGQLDLDDRTGTGPENIYWSTDYEPPPNGRYHVCVKFVDFDPALSASHPVTVTLATRRNGQLLSSISKKFTAAPDSFGCDATRPGYFGYLDYGEAPDAGSPLP